jgi:hypothetical protein
MTPHNDPDYDQLSLLRAGMSQLVSKHYRYNTSHTTIFLKTYSEETLICPYKDYSSLTSWQANWVLLSALTFYNVLFCNVAHINM